MSVSSSTLAGSIAQNPSVNCQVEEQNTEKKINIFGQVSAAVLATISTVVAAITAAAIFPGAAQAAITAFAAIPSAGLAVLLTATVAAAGLLIWGVIEATKKIAALNLSGAPAAAQLQSQAAGLQANAQQVQANAQQVQANAQQVEANAQQAQQAASQVANTAGAVAGLASVAANAAGAATNVAPTQV